MRIFRKTCQVCGEKTRQYKKCPLCGRYTCIPDIMEMQMVGMGNKCAYCGSDIIGKHIIVHAPATIPNPLRRNRPTTDSLPTINMEDFNKLSNYPPPARQAKYDWKGVISCLWDSPMRLKTLYDTYPWGDRKPLLGMVWSFLRRECSRGTISKKVDDKGEIWYGPPKKELTNILKRNIQDRASKP